MEIPELVLPDLLHHNSHRTNRTCPHCTEVALTVLRRSRSSPVPRRLPPSGDDPPNLPTAPMSPSCSTLPRCTCTAHRDHTTGRFVPAPGAHLRYRWCSAAVGPVPRRGTPAPLPDQGARYRPDSTNRPRCSRYRGRFRPARGTPRPGSPASGPETWTREG
uniref:(northern house mosquito) hypothetical protein n=1 Tax=Culex pipiens TaxID=7175 RepID=A0A8D8DBB8_CULPI